MQKSARRGLSLVELLIVLGIVVVLIGILIPTIGAVRRRSKITVCAANLRQIGQGLFMYRAECRTWPNASPIPLPFTMPWEDATPTLPEKLAPYLPPGSGVYHCPGDSEQVYIPCSLVPGGRGISYFYWQGLKVPPGSNFVFPLLLSDFQGWAGKTKSVSVGQFHPPHMGMNQLHSDGGVDFGYASVGGN